MGASRLRILATVTALLLTVLAACEGGRDDMPVPEGEEPIGPGGPAPLIGVYTDRSGFRNPYGHIPAQCYIETLQGTQNACLFCHTNGVFLQGLGNNNPQAGYEPIVGDLQREYAFASLRYPYVVNGSVMPWENTLRPERLRAAVDALGIDPAVWDMRQYIREDNWSAAFAARPGSPLDWDPRENGPFRLLPGLDPADLPADEDGFVRSSNPGHGHFEDAGGVVTGWRAINFMPYGIFTPHSGSVSGVYIRLPVEFMRNSSGEFDRATYEQNLNLLERAIQDRLSAADPATYYGAASQVAVQRGLYPVGTEFAHPLHYVDVAADGSDRTVSPFPGTRSRRVREVRYMYKHKPFNPDAAPPGSKEEEAPIYANSNQGWTDNGAGWYLAGFIENAEGALRPQTAAELTQCVGCHSGNALQSRLGYEEFTAGTGNTVDSTWSFPRKFAGEPGWQEMNYLAYLADSAAGDNGTPGRARLGDPLNRKTGAGEFRLFLEHVVGVSLYGDMPTPVEAFMAGRISTLRGYSGNWPALDTSSAEALLTTQKRRQALMREMTAGADYLDTDGTIHGALLYPPLNDALAAAARYRQVVVSQRYDLGKDVFDTTPLALRYFRTEETAFTHQDGSAYQVGDIVTDRPVDTNPASLTYGTGMGRTLIEPELPFAEGGTYEAGYAPLLAYPMATQ